MSSRSSTPTPDQMGTKGSPGGGDTPRWYQGSGSTDYNEGFFSREFLESINTHNVLFTKGMFTKANNAHELWVTEARHGVDVALKNDTASTDPSDKYGSSKTKSPDSSEESASKRTLFTALRELGITDPLWTTEDSPVEKEAIERNLMMKLATAALAKAGGFLGEPFSEISIIDFTAAKALAFQEEAAYHRVKLTKRDYKLRDQLTYYLSQLETVDTSKTEVAKDEVERDFKRSFGSLSEYAQRLGQLEMLAYRGEAAKTGAFDSV